MGKTKLPVDEYVLLNSPAPEAMIILDADGLNMERAAEAPNVRLLASKIRLPVFNVSVPATKIFPDGSSQIEIPTSEPESPIVSPHAYRILCVYESGELIMSSKIEETRILFIFRIKSLCNFLNHFG